MSFTYNISTNVGKVRLNIQDIDLTTITGIRSGWTVLFTDEEIEVFLARASSNLNLASYYALLSVASSKALVAKMQKIGDYTEDLKGTAAAIRSQADAFKKIVDGEPVMEIASMDLTFEEDE